MKILPCTIALLLVTAACDRTTQPARDDGTCQQTYEFGNTGCFEVTGRVIDSTGRALAGMYVGAGPVATNSGFTSPYATTDATGAFAVRASRMFALGPPATPDTITVVVRAADPSSAGVGIPATRRDSARAVVAISPVGRVPNPAVVVLTLPVR